MIWNPAPGRRVLVVGSEGAPFDCVGHEGTIERVVPWDAGDDQGLGSAAQIDVHVRVDGQADDDRPAIYHPPELRETR